ncbi:hypothetical protein ZEAMMB73_Zm00001d006745 [Zea mays]|uniref:Uncharacterized protein n=1 Tax=Zea mays TaxID=4577 RepID=A0A1D6F056_MAIZE|nr:hypothetical protein ZEAMMB73_Zm00001d006745 [Zea mays]
MCQMIFLTV